MADVITTIAATSSPTTPDYTSLQAWEDDIPADLVAADERHIGECLDQGVFDGAGSTLLTIGGHTTDATRNIVLRCATGASFRDKPGVRSSALFYNESNGVALKNSGYGHPILAAGQSYVSVSGLQVKQSGVRSAVAWQHGDNGAIVDDCICESNSSVAVAFPRKVINCLIASASSGLLGTSDVSVFGCTIVRLGSTGGDAISVNYGSSVVKNTAIFNFTNPVTGTTSYTVSYCATDAASLTGSNNVTSLTFADQFESTTNDFRTKESADLFGEGDYDGTNTPDDITGAPRNTTTPTIGAWEPPWEEVTTIGATSSPITPDYTSLQAWEDDSPSDLTDVNYKWVGECLDQGVFTSASTLLTISGTTADSTRTIILRCASGASFADKVGVRTSALLYNESDGVAIKCTGGYANGINVTDDYVILRGLQVNATQSSSNALMLNGSNTCMVQDCILIGPAAPLRVAGSAVVTATNCLIVSDSSPVQNQNGTTNVYGCTLIGDGGNAAFLCEAYTTTTTKNCAVFNVSADKSGSGTLNASYIATDLASFTGSNNVTSLTFADQFENTSTDFRAKSTGDLQAGTPDSTNTPDDITGLTRDTTTPWIGCWEVSVVVATPPFNFDIFSGGVFE